MGLIVHKDKITPILGEKLQKLCPFGAISYDGKELSIGMGCKSCKLCVKNGEGAITFEEEKVNTIDKSQWNGVVVFCEHFKGKIHNITFELLGKAKELADVNGHKVMALMIGSGITAQSKELFCYGADEVYVYDDPGLENFLIEPYANVFEDFIRKIKPSSILVGATNIGRSLAPRVAARIETGLTADCTALEMTKDTDLVQIRPAFGGNIVATIVNPEHRPQMATVREGVMKKEILDLNYKGEVITHEVAQYVPDTEYVVKVLDRHIEKAKHNLKGASIVVAGGYGVGSREGFDMLFELAKELHAEVGASRAAVDAGFADHDRQIGQTGVTVRPKVYIACGISGQIQHIAGMQDAGIIISINNDPNAPINTLADYVINGTVEEVVPKMIKYYKKNSK